MTEPEDLAGAVVKQIYSGNSGYVFFPRYFGLLAGIKGLPHWIQEPLRLSSANTVKAAVLEVRAKEQKA